MILEVGMHLHAVYLYTELSLINMLFHFVVVVLALNQDEFSVLHLLSAVFLKQTAAFPSVARKMSGVRLSIHFRERSFHWIPFDRKNNRGIKLLGLLSKSPW